MGGAARGPLRQKEEEMESCEKKTQSFTGGHGYVAGFWLCLCAKICNFVMKYAHVHRAARTNRRDTHRHPPTAALSAAATK